jgi:hypothetical protein
VPLQPSAVGQPLLCAATAAQADLQQELVARGLEQQGKKEELASRLLDSLIAQVCISFCLLSNPLLFAGATLAWHVCKHACTRLSVLHLYFQVLCTCTAAATTY